MAKKPFPFSVCEECCTTGGGGGTVDVTAIETIVIDNLSGVTAKQLIESSKEGSVFDIQGTLNLYNEGITFPERSTIISTTGDGVIYNPYDGSVDYVDVIISNNSTVKGVTFKSSATMSTPASTFKIMNNCTFEDCTFIGESDNSSIYETGANNIFIGCDMGEFDLKFSDTELTNTYVNCTGNLYIETDVNKPEELKKAQYIKAMNPETVITDWRTNTEIEPLYASPDDIPEAINGKDGKDGKDGEDGKDGYTPIKGIDYFDGTNGKDGKDGASVTVSNVSESSADGGSNIVTFSDGKTLTVKNGSKGSKGDKGDKGETGATGEQGLQGEKGADGTNGKDGKSAYEYAKEGGYTGTEAQFSAKLAEDIKSNAETWTFTLADGSTVTKKVVLA